MARTAFRQPATSKTRLRVKSARAQSLHEVSILFGCPDCQHFLSVQARCAVSSFIAVDDRSCSASADSAVPASVYPPTIFALPRVFAAIVASGLDAAAQPLAS